MGGTWCYKKVFYDYWTTQLRNFYFFTSGIHGNQSKYERAIWDKRPKFPETVEEYEEACVPTPPHQLEEPPLVPYDVPHDTWIIFWAFRPTRNMTIIRFTYLLFSNAFNRFNNTSVFK